MLNPSEQRTFHRMPIRAGGTLRRADEEREQAVTVVDLSAVGVLMECDEPIPPGTRAELILPPGTSATPPLRAHLEVLRCTPPDEQESRQDGFSVACRIIAILEA
ncbi:MAG: hypothetical protein B0D96_05195 [Candidatus Sedimenticola endophacoides]|uniref:PilZ domain-containing protein n=2 Tax=Candidatus Sedimenticola endophacoides TaxID=2548426 RepID=A0A6N4DLP6_9GAMM|nr:MAG: hypothetical protein B0D94_03880 [Candidatus Sedimenticola endophacoides]OQX36056.1 MAG: hypothetical protein B0D96_05195 [Candidatus Sedimenticola endophacoides]OQX40082.1 MAG: hypothetical protein B0D89_09025 [Candidatus Sedimenticola endophacoides]OQX45628.1 MAG: hypothetical protein B0D86_03275 [Candidatus Sedimenticola endophacoides]PUD99591.1 MAG: hypothetical protein C3L26_08675 [Candidatus Sedimenticola endophacoides]